MEPDASGFPRVVVDVKEEHGDRGGGECFGSARWVYGTGARDVKSVPLGTFIVLYTRKIEMNFITIHDSLPDLLLGHS